LKGCLWDTASRYPILLIHPFKKVLTIRTELEVCLMHGLPQEIPITVAVEQ
jgi:hypothetical protein